MATRTITTCDHCKKDAPVTEATIMLTVERGSAADLTHVAVWWESNINKKMDLCKNCFEALRARMLEFLEADFDAIGAARDRSEPAERFLCQKYNNIC